MNKNFVNYHILISHSPSCLNRDDMNMQKSAVFGGKRRVRVSSQSLKRTMRTSKYYGENCGEASIRSKHLDLLKVEFVEVFKDEFDEPTIHEALERFAKTKTTNESEEEPVSEENEKAEKKLAVAPWIKEEFKIICNAIKEVKQEGLTKEEQQKAKENLKWPSKTSQNH